MDNEHLLIKIKQLEDELRNTKEQLSKYTMKNKNYYEKNKEEFKQRVKEYKQKTNYTANITEEKKKEYNKTAYLNRKEKMKNKMDNKYLEKLNN
jgi:hypothetical protein